MKVRSVWILVALALYIINGSDNAEASIADDITPFLGLGSTMWESKATIGDIGFRYNDEWQLTRRFIGGGENKWGGQEPKGKVIIIDRIFNPIWFDGHFFSGIGVAHVENSSLVEPWNFHITMGWKLQSSRFTFSHISSGDINEVNTGMNVLAWHKDLPL